MDSDGPFGSLFGNLDHFRPFWMGKGMMLSRAIAGGPSTRLFGQTTVFWMLFWIILGHFGRGKRMMSSKALVSDVIGVM